MTTRKDSKAAEGLSFRRVADVKREWMADPEFRKAYHREIPYEEVARAIVHLRVRYGLSQNQFAHKVGRPQSYIAKLESGKANVRIETLQSIAEAFGEALSIDFVQAAALASELEKGTARSESKRSTEAPVKQAARTAAKRPPQRAITKRPAAKRLAKISEKTPVVA